MILYRRNHKFNTCDKKDPDFDSQYSCIVKFLPATKHSTISSQVNHEVLVIHVMEDLVIPLATLNLAIGPHYIYIYISFYS